MADLIGNCSGASSLPANFSTHAKDPLTLTASSELAPDLAPPPMPKFAKAETARYRRLPQFAPPIATTEVPLITKPPNVPAPVPKRARISQPQPVPEPLTANDPAPAPGSPANSAPAANCRSPLYARSGTASSRRAAEAAASAALQAASAHAAAVATTFTPVIASIGARTAASEIPTAAATTSAIPATSLPPPTLGKVSTPAPTPVECQRANPLVTENMRRPRKIFIFELGFSGQAPRQRAVEIAAVEYIPQTNMRGFHFETLVKPEPPTPRSRFYRKQITWDVLQRAPNLPNAWGLLCKYIEVCCSSGSGGPSIPVLIAHNATFSFRHLRRELLRNNVPWPDWRCGSSLQMARQLQSDFWPIPGRRKNSLLELYKRYVGDPRFDSSASSHLFAIYDILDAWETKLKPLRLNIYQLLLVNSEVSL